MSKCYPITELLHLHLFTKCEEYGLPYVNLEKKTGEKVVINYYGMEEFIAVLQNVQQTSNVSPEVVTVDLNQYELKIVMKDKTNCQLEYKKK